MNLSSLILDHFFDEPHKVREEIVGLPFDGYINPVDKVLYPDIAQVSEDVADEVELKLQQIIRPNGIINLTHPVFARLSLFGGTAPHQAHTDLIMGDWTAIIYLNLPKQCKGGTQILEHVSGMSEHPFGHLEQKVWEQDTNNYYAWKVVGGAKMAFNRCFIVQSKLFHRAMPVGGFGHSADTGRLIIGAFFKEVL